MVNRRRLSFLLTGVAVCFLCGSLLAFFSGDAQTQNNQQKQRATILRRGAPSTDQPPTDKELDDAATPIVDLYDSSPVDSDRQLKNSRYDGHHFVEHEVGPRTGEIVMEGRGNVADVPVNDSDLVIEGHVTESSAFLSNDKANVYSEFRVRVTDVLKRASNLGVKPGDLIVTERAGGRVRYPDGRVIRYSVVGQGSLMKGSKYLLFLSKAGQGSYKILTGYELRGNKVFALDGVRINNGLGSWPFDKHNGEDYEKMRKGAEDAVQHDKGRGRS